METSKYSILHLVTSYKLRGAEVFASQLARVLSKLGHSNMLWSLYGEESDDFPFPDEVHVGSIKATKRGLWSKFGFNPLIAVKLSSVLKELKPDVIIAHGSDTMKYSSIAGLLNRHSVIIYRNIGMASYWSHSLYSSIFYKFLLRKICAVISVSKNSRADFIKSYKYNQDRVSTIYNAIDSSLFSQSQMEKHRERVRQSLGLNGGDVALICIGSISPEKNQIVLLHLIRDLTKSNLHLILVGDGPNKASLEKLAGDLGIGKSVHFLGYQQHVAPFLAAADLFVLPSKSEGLPGVLIEAGSAGLASVAYDVGGVNEIITSDVTGMIVPPENYEKFKRAVLVLISDPDRRKRMGVNAQREIPEKFDINVVAKEYSSLISRILRERRRNNVA